MTQSTICGSITPWSNKIETHRQAGVVAAEELCAWRSEVACVRNRYYSPNFRWTAWTPCPRTRYRYRDYRYANLQDTNINVQEYFKLCAINNTVYKIVNNTIWAMCNLNRFHFNRATINVMARKWYSSTYLLHFWCLYFRLDWSLRWWVVLPFVNLAREWRRYHHRSVAPERIIHQGSHPGRHLENL